MVGSRIKRSINVVDDPAQSTVGGTGRSASPVNFIGFTLGDKIKQKWPASRVIGVSMKDRASILVTGHRADGAFWFEGGCGCFITSTYYAKQVPTWLAAFNKLELPQKMAGSSWTRLLPETALYEKYAGPDAAPGEADLVNNVFPTPSPPSRPMLDFIRP